MLKRLMPEQMRCREAAVGHRDLTTRILVRGSGLGRFAIHGECCLYGFYSELGNHSTRSPMTNCSERDHQPDGKRPLLTFAGCTERKILPDGVVAIRESTAACSGP